MCIRDSPGGVLFNLPQPIVNSSNNAGSAVIDSQIVDASAVTSSDYRLQYDGTNYKITRLTDKSVQTFASLPQTVDGLSFTQASGTMNAGDDFMIRPTLSAANNISLAITCLLYTSRCV